MSEESEPETGWYRWCVRPDSGFQVFDPSGRVGLVQITETDFLVTTKLRFKSDEVEADLRKRLASAGRMPDEIDQMVSDAMTLTPSEVPTNLASIPQFMQWFERPYGIHTLAALIHDDLIVKTPNGGALGSDTMADHYFRRMLEACGMQLIKRWIIWGAVALRSRWAAGGYRRLSLLAWGLSALTGITSFAVAVGWTIVDGGVPSLTWVLVAIASVLLIVSGLAQLASRPLRYAVALLATVFFVTGLAVALKAGAVPTGAWVLACGAVGLPGVTAILWGKQWRASLVAAVAGIFVIPGAVFVALGLGIYFLLEQSTNYVGQIRSSGGPEN